MPVNLLNERDLNDYLTDIVYRGQETPSYSSGDFKSVDYVRQNKDGIVKAILAQYIKHRLRSYLVDKEDVSFLSKVKMAKDLPGWARKSISEGRDVFRFDARKMTSSTQNDITEIRDFLYSTADNYVDKTLATAEHTKQSPKLRLDYLKTNNEYDTFERVLFAAHKWHEIMAKKAEKIKKDKELFKKSLKGTEFVMDLPDGMAAYRLNTKKALDFETKYMGHCVGKGDYDRGIKDGSIQIYSIRDKNGEPHVTFEIQENEIYQCKGKGNKIPAKYRPVIQEFVRQKRFNIEGDSANTGLIQQDGKYYDIYHLPKGFVVKGNLDFRGEDITELPDLSDVIVKGNFICSDTQITSLKGSPLKVEKSFYCSNTQITSLEGISSIGEGLYCSCTQITSLKWAPREIHGDFNCSNTPITSLAGASESVDGDFNCSSTQITSLAGAPNPENIGGYLFCSFTQIKDTDAEIRKWRKGFYNKKVSSDKKAKENASKVKKAKVLKSVKGKEGR